MSEKIKLDGREVMKRWLADIRSDGSSRYLYNKRQEHIELLMQYFLEHGVEQIEAQVMKNKVVEYLVTPEGLKGKNNHKGWKENTENDFDDAVQRTYVPAPSSIEFKRQKTAQGYDPRIVKWAKARWGDHVGDDIIIAAHQPLHLFWMMWMKDQYNLHGRM